MEIPVRYGSPCRIGNGMNLQREIHSMRGLADVPIIVMTAHGHGSPRLAVDVMKHRGAVDFVMKPFSEADPPLEQVIEEVLRVTHRDHPGAKSHSELDRDPAPPLLFEQGEMVFSETRVELCGVRICDGVGSGLVRAILDILREKDSRGKFVALSGEELAQRAGDTMTRQNDIADAVRRLRERIETVLLEEANIRCTRQDVVTNDRRYGYRLSSKITVRDADDVRSDPNKDADDVRNGPIDPRSSQDDVRNPSARQEWILAELGTKGEMRKDEVFPGYKKWFGLSKTTLERDLNALRRRGLIRFHGEKRTGRWRRV
jgi:CheY-like chemotaxis protein